MPNAKTPGVSVSKQRRRLKVYAEKSDVWAVNLAKLAAACKKKRGQLLG